MPTPGVGEADRGRTLSDRPGGDDLSVLCSNSGNWNEVRDQFRSLGFKLPFVDGEAPEGAARCRGVNTGKPSKGQMFHFRRNKDDQPGVFPVELQVSA